MGSGVEEGARVIGGLIEVESAGWVLCRPVSTYCSASLTCASRVSFDEEESRGESKSPGVLDVWSKLALREHGEIPALRTHPRL